ncbi:uncharacterized protein LOC113360158 [Papaver somniferum]|uniref:uncharacterized protein LOC113360158 n=1 Tax=Papaver somniferum TaxID=3469 RepID=UPI000E6FA1B0|nr:uncharacterized protein LOC113360158 [Papaver somniferum]
MQDVAEEQIMQDAGKRKVDDSRLLNETCSQPLNVVDNNMVMEQIPTRNSFYVLREVTMAITEVINIGSSVKVNISAAENLYPNLGTKDHQSSSSSAGGNGAKGHIPKNIYIVRSVHQMGTDLKKSARGWNIRGMNDPLKKVEVMNFIRINNLSIVGIVETHVQSQNKDRIRRVIRPDWQFIDNNSKILLGFGLGGTLQQFQFLLFMLQISNDPQVRKLLWVDILNFSSTNSHPLLLVGEFNSILFPHEKVDGIVTSNNYLYFWNCTQDSFLFDLAYSGCFHTWKNGHTDDNRILSKLDRAMVNMEWVTRFSDSKAVFLEAGISDHSSMVVSIFEDRVHGPPPFKFYNFMTEEPDFLNLVREVWEEPVRGNPMFVFITKLKKVKSRIIQWKRERFKNIPALVEIAKDELCTIQKHIQQFPMCVESAQHENLAIKKYAKSSFVDDSEFLDSLKFENLLKDEHKCDLIKPVTRDEVVLALSTIGSSKAPGTDGFSSWFFKSCWSVLGDDFTAPVQNFFKHSKLLKEHVLGGLISANQFAFISGREIQDNVLVAHELLRNYHRTVGSPRCTLKIDIKKGYDTVSWKVVILALQQFGFPPMFIEWIR